MSLVELVGSSVSGLETIAERMRSSVRPAESMAEVKANNIVYTLAEVVEELARGLKRLRCTAEASEVKGDRVASLCTSWRLYRGGEGGIVVLRVKPESVIRFDGGRLFFHRDHVRMEVEGTRVRLCRWSYCKEFDAADRRSIIEEMPQILYLLRFVANAVRKTVEAATVCARREAPECARLY